jgi:hypothetical protein
MLRSFALVFACVSCPPAQEPATASSANDVRGSAIGEVRDATGKPWLGAEVVLLSRPLPHDSDAGEVDRVVARVDERGRFRASILRGRPYTVWAWGDATASGRPASAVADRVFVQQPIVLQQERVLPLRDVVLDHRERWEGFTFRVRVVDGTWNRYVHWLDVVDGRARLPWLVAASAQIDVLAVREGVEHPLPRATVVAKAGDVAIELPEQKRATCFAMDEGDTPLANAPIFRSHGDVLYRVGTTDAEGRFSLVFGEATPQRRMTTLVHAAHGAMGVFGRVGDYAGDAKFKAPAGAQPDDLLCRIRGGKTVYARFVDAHGKPMPDLEVWHSGLATSRPMPSSALHKPWFTTSRTDRDGVVRLAGPPAPSATVRVDAHALLRERDLAALPPAWRQGLAPVMFAPLVAATGKGTKDDPLVVTPASLCPVEFTFVGAGGTPASNAEVGLGAQIPNGITVWWPRRNGCGAICDERGRLRVLVPAARHIGISATADMSLLIRAFETTPGRIDAGPASVTLQLPAPTGIRGRLLDADGTPLTEEKVVAMFGTDNTPAEWDYATDPESALVNSKGNALRILLPESARGRLMLTSLIGWPVPTDAEGRFALPLPPVRIPSMQVYRQPDDGFIMDSRVLEWTGAPIDDFELKVRRF